VHASGHRIPVELAAIQSADALCIEIDLAVRFIGLGGVLSLPGNDDGDPLGARRKGAAERINEAANRRTSFLIYSRTM